MSIRPWQPVVINHIRQFVHGGRNEGLGRQLAKYTDVIRGHQEGSV